MGNHKIGITAEFSALIKESRNGRYRIFISPKSRQLFKLCVKIFGRQAIDNIFRDRINLSDEFDSIVRNGKQDTIVDLGCGFSLRNFESSLADTRKTYIDIDFPEMIEEKRHRLSALCDEEEIAFPRNYQMFPADLLTEDVVRIVGGLARKNILMTAEGLTPYFDMAEYDAFLLRLKPLLMDSSNAFFGQENIRKNKSVPFKIIRSILAVMTMNKSHAKFETEEDLSTHLASQGFKEVRAYTKFNHLFYWIN